MRTALIIATSIAMVAAPARGQSINVDYGSVAGTPADTYAGAGVPGIWNALHGGTLPQKVIDVRGRFTSATLTLSSGGIVMMDDPGTTGDDEALLDDGILGGGDVIFTLTIDGLRPDDRDVAAYVLVTAVQSVAHRAALDHPEYVGSPALENEICAFVLRYLVGHDGSSAPSR